MEAMHASDLIFFRRTTPSPIPRIYDSSDKDDSTNVSSEMIDSEIASQEVKATTEFPAVPTLKVTAHDERRLQIQNVRKTSSWCLFLLAQRKKNRLFQS